MCYPCAAGIIAPRRLPLSSGALSKQQAEKSPDTAGAGRRRDARGNESPSPGATQKLIKSFVESY
jgi:hypothetical protein